MLKNPKLTFFVGANGRHFWHVTRGNNNILASSAQGNGFSRKSGAVHNFKRTRNALGMCAYSTGL